MLYPIDISIWTDWINPLMTSLAHYIETSQLTCGAIQLTGFYMMETIGR